MHVTTNETGNMWASYPRISMSFLHKYALSPPNELPFIFRTFPESYTPHTVSLQYRPLRLRLNVLNKMMLSPFYQPHFIAHLHHPPYSLLTRHNLHS